jgi:aminocarboxymuconate-semialdehyde decarboxylase
MSTVPAIDCHDHAMLPAIDRLVAGQPGLLVQQEQQARLLAGGDGAALRAAIAPIIPKLTDPALRVSDLDSAGVDVQLVSPSPQHYHPWADAALATDVFQAANEAIAAHCAQCPTRLRGLGLAPIQHGDVAVAALEHALAQGLHGVEIPIHAAGGATAVRLLEL